VFDLLAENGTSYLKLNLRERRRLLDKFARSNFRSAENVRLSPATTNLKIASKWFKKAGGDLDGIIAKRLDRAYASGERTAAVKIKQIRTADCVVGGFRYATGARVIGSLLLGLYGDDGLLHHVGFMSGFKASDRGALTKKFEALKKPPGFTGNAPGGPSRWSTERTGESPVTRDSRVRLIIASSRRAAGSVLRRWMLAVACSRSTCAKTTYAENVRLFTSKHSVKGVIILLCQKKKQ